MIDEPVPVRTEYIGEVDGGHLWQVWRTDTNEPIGWNLVPIVVAEEGTDETIELTPADLIAEAQTWAVGSINNGDN